MFVTNWISTTKIQKISEITNFFRHYFLSRTEVVYSNSKACGTSVATTRGPKAEAAFIKVNYNNFYPTNVAQWTKTATVAGIISYNNLVNRNVVLEGCITKKR